MAQMTGLRMHMIKMHPAAVRPASGEALQRVHAAAHRQDPSGIIGHDHDDPERGRHGKPGARPRGWITGGDVRQSAHRDRSYQAFLLEGSFDLKDQTR